MQIKIEIDVRPDELRRFVGLPDVAGLQDEVIHFLREKLSQAGESFDAAAFVRNNLKVLSHSPLLGRLFPASRTKASGAAGKTAANVSVPEGSPDGAPDAVEVRGPKRPRSAGTKRPRRKGKAAKPARRQKSATPRE